MVSVESHLFSLVLAPRVCEGSEGSAIYVDLAYLPSGSASSTVDVELFKRIRSSYYIISGDDPLKEAAMRRILDSLLEGKSSWAEVQVGEKADFMFVVHLLII